jgi:hypothetical protein
MSGDGFREELLPDVEVECTPLAGGRLRLAVYHEVTAVHSAVYNLKILGSVTLRGQFVNRVCDQLDGSGVDTDAVERALREWFTRLHDTADEERRALLPEDIQGVLDGTQQVEIVGGSPTTVHVNLEWNGETRELEFTADEMTGDGGALVSQMANQFYEFDFEIGPDEWAAVVEEWQDRAEVVAVVEETAEETIAGRVLEYVALDLMPVTERGKLATGPAAAWVDATNAAATGAAPPDDPVVWIERTFLLDELDRAGKATEYLGQLIKTLNQRGDLYGVPESRRQRWPNSQGKDRAVFYPFRPESVGVDVESMTEAGRDEPVHDEVEP